MVRQAIDARGILHPYHVRIKVPPPLNSNQGLRFQILPYGPLPNWHVDSSLPAPVPYPCPFLTGIEPRETSRAPKLCRMSPRDHIPLLGWLQDQIDSAEVDVILLLGG